MTDERLPASALAGAPDAAKAASAFAAFCLTIAQLRDPQRGCPWDLKQDHLSLRRYMLEEAYEAAEAMAEPRPGELCDELGDVLLQVVLNAQVALDAQGFSIVDVIEAIDAKMRRRHPHVFHAATPELSVAAVQANWQDIKAAEKAAKKAPAPAAAQSRLFTAAYGKHPASAQAVQIGRLAAKINFDWPNLGEVWQQVRSEVAELDVELTGASIAPAKAAEELGDVYFSLAQLSRHMQLDPEVVALDANRKFLRRFAAVEALASRQGVVLEQASSETWAELWRQVKDDES